MDDIRLLANVRQMIESSPFHGEGYRKVWARLRFAGEGQGCRLAGHDDQDASVSQKLSASSGQSQTVL